MIGYKISPAKDHFAPLEPVRLVLRIRNGESHAVDLPNPAGMNEQPSFRIGGPGPEQVRSVTAADLSRNTFSLERPPDRIRVEAGSDWNGEVVLGPRQGIGGPGTYVVSSGLLKDGLELESAEVRFEVDPLTPVEFGIGFGVNPMGPAEGEITFLHRTGAAAYLYGSSFQETSPSISEAEVGEPSLRTEMGPDAGDTGLPQRNGPYFDEIDQWTVWREGREVVALSSLGEGRRIQLPATPARLAIPPLKPAGGPLEVLAVSAGRPEVTLLLFPQRRGSATEIAWTLPLPAPPDNITASSGPASAGSDGHVGVISAGEDGVQVSHVRYRGTVPPEAFNTVLVPGCRPLAGAAMAVHGYADGSARIGTFVQSKGSTQLAAFVEVVFPPGTRGSIDVRKPLGRLAEEPSGGAVLFWEPHGGGPLRTDAVLAIPGSGLMKLADGSLRPLAVQGTPSDPMLLTPGYDRTYIVFLNDMRLPRLEPI
jgi:hypothetical protein